MRPLHSPTALFFLTIACVLYLLPARPAGAASQIKASPHTTGGYCGVHGRIIRSDAADCKKQHGVFFKDQKTARAWLDSQQPGYCCAAGKVARTKKDDCAKRKDTFFKTKKEAVYYCDRHRKGFCCQKGKVLAMEKGACMEKKGLFFQKRNSAARFCKDNQNGFCCLKDRALPMKRGKCNQRKGKFFKGKKAAADYCEVHHKGFCCTGGKVVPMEKGKCGKKKGRFTTTMPEAKKSCEPNGWCAVAGKLIQCTRNVCRARKGQFFTSRLEAGRAMTTRKPSLTISSMQTRPGLGDKKVMPGKKPARRTATERKRPLTLTAKPMHRMDSHSAITICRIYLEKNIIQVQLNKSGTAPLIRKALNTAILTLAAGTAHKNWAMSKVDPQGNLLKGNMVIFDTGIHITAKTRAKAALTQIAGNQQKTVWLSPLPDRIVMGGMQAVKPEKSTPILKKKKSSFTSVDKFMGTRINGTGLDNIPQGVPLRLDRGLSIVSPSGPGPFFMGRNLKVRFLFSGDVESSEVTVSVRNWNTGATVVSKTTEAHYQLLMATLEVELDLPLNMDTSATYFVSVVHPSGAYGESDVFSVREFFLRTATEADNLSLEPNRNIYQPGEEVTVRIHSSKEVGMIFPDRNDLNDSPGPMHFFPYLWRSEDGHHEYDSETGDHLVRVRLPNEDTGNNRCWAITARMNDSSSLISPRFMISHIGEGGTSGGGGGTQAAWGIRFVSPGHTGNEVWYYGDTHPIAWRLAGEYPAERNFIITLKDQVGRTVQTIPAEDAVWHENSKSYTLDWHISQNVRSRYHFVIEEQNSPVEARSEPFDIRYPVVFEGPFREGGSTVATNLYWWNRYTIRWHNYAITRESLDVGMGFAPDNDVLLGSINDTRGSLCFTVPASGSYTSEPAIIMAFLHGGTDGLGIRGQIAVELNISPPSLAFLEPHGGEVWHSGDSHYIRWSFHGFPSRINGHPPKINIDLIGNPDSGPPFIEHIARNYRIHRANIPWVVDRGHNTDWSPEAGPIVSAHAEYGTGHMGGIPPGLPSGTYMLYLSLAPATPTARHTPLIFVQSESFRIDN